MSSFTFYILHFTFNPLLRCVSTALALTLDRQITVAALTNSFVIRQKATAVKNVKSKKIKSVMSILSHFSMLCYPSYSTLNLFPS